MDWREREFVEVSTRAQKSLIETGGPGRTWVWTGGNLRALGDLQQWKWNHIDDGEEWGSSEVVIVRGT